jgi:hypothetical protein
VREPSPPPKVFMYRREPPRPEDDGNGKSQPGPPMAFGNAAKSTLPLQVWYHRIEPAINQDQLYFHFGPGILALRSLPSSSRLRL